MPATLVHFYHDDQGVPVLEWLRELRRTDQPAYAKCVARIRLLARQRFTWPASARTSPNCRCAWSGSRIWNTYSVASFSGCRRPAAASSRPCRTAARASGLR